MELPKDSEKRNYQYYLYTAIEDNSPENDLLAAILAPTEFLKDLNNFELTFDKVIHHLEQAIQKCAEVDFLPHTKEKSGNQRQIEKIQRLSEEIFHWYINQLYSNIQYARKVNRENFLSKTKRLFLGTSLEKPSLNALDITAFFSNSPQLILVKDALRLLAHYLDEIYLNWELDRKEANFLKQLAHIYVKTVRSPIYNRERFSLIRNTFNSVQFRNDLLISTIEFNGIETAINMAEFAGGNFPAERKRNHEIITEYLIKNNDYHALKEYLPKIKKMVGKEYRFFRMRTLSSYWGYLKATHGGKEISPILLVLIISTFLSFLFIATFLSIDTGTGIRGMVTIFYTLVFFLVCCVAGVFLHPAIRKYLVMAGRL